VTLPSVTVLTTLFRIDVLEAVVSLLLAGAALGYCFERLRVLALESHRPPQYLPPYRRGIYRPTQSAP
jgi:hypothetical protein